MKKIKDVKKLELVDKDLGIIKYCDRLYILCGCEYSAQGVKNYLRLWDKYKQAEKRLGAVFFVYITGKQDVEYYILNDVKNHLMK